MSSKIKSRCAIPIPRKTSFFEDNSLGTGTLLNDDQAPEIKFYQHRLDRPMDLLAFFEMPPSDRTKYLVMFNEEFGFQLQDYMNFFHADKVTMYNILKDHGVKLKKTGGMSGSQERLWKKFLAQNWEQPSRPLDLAEPVVREIREKSGIYDEANGKVIAPTNEEIDEAIYELKAQPKPATEVATPTEEATAVQPKIEKHIVIRNFNAQPVTFEVKIDSIDNEIAQEIINFIIEKKVENPVGVGKISFTLPSAN